MRVSAATIVKSNKPKTHRLAILGKIDTTDAPKGTEKLLQIRLGRVLRDIRNPDGVRIPVVEFIPSPVADSRGHGLEGLPTQISTPLPWWNIFSPALLCDTGRPRGRHRPAVSIACEVVIILRSPFSLSLDVVLPLQLAALLLCPERVQVAGESLFVCCFVL